MRPTHAGPAWRIAPSGTTACYLARIEGDVALVHGQGMKGRWAERPMKVAARDVFADREAARAEYRRRHAEALANDPYASRNVTTSDFDRETRR